MDFFSAVSDGEDHTVVVQTPSMEIARLHLAMGTRIPTYEAQGEIVILCMAGQVTVEAMNGSLSLTSGNAVFLLLNAPFSLSAALESSLLLVTVSGPSSSTSDGESSGDARAPDD
jgi:quercetin dioxygenase-like cupin family protein